MLEDEIEKIEGEEWKYIEGFEELYAISNFGRLASFCSGKWSLRKLTNKKGDYLRVVLISSRKRKSISVHRIVANSFVQNPNSNKYIHHIDGNKQNNRAENLIWISGKEHYKLHLEKNPNIIDGMRNYNTHIKPKMIYQFYRDGEYIQCFENANEAHRATGVCARNILQVANREKTKSGRRRYTAGGYIWSFEKNIDLRGWYDGCTL